MQDPREVEVPRAGPEVRVVEGEGGIPVVVMGLGEIGQAIARAAIARPELRLVAAVDPAFAGRTLAEVLGRPAPDLAVLSGLGDAARAAAGGAVLHATGSRLAEVLPQLEEAVRARLSVVSTCEELAYPWLSGEEAADALNRLCEKNGVTVVAAGVNPGFVLDRLPVVLSHVTGPIRKVSALRRIDASRRRVAFRRKIGVGLTEEEFEAAAERGELGHVGLPESAALVAKGCGLEFDELDEEIESVIAAEDSPEAAAGRVAGIRQVASLLQDGREVVRLELQAHLGAEDARDEIDIDADPPLRAVIPGGVPGEAATANAIVHAARTVGALAPGLATVLDLPVGR